MSDHLEDPLGLSAQARKAEAVRLDPSMSPSTAFVVVAGECVDHWRTNAPLLRETRAAPHLHQTRVGIRRLRSAFSLFRPLLREVPGSSEVAHRLRALALPFGPARDLDVLLSGPLGSTLDHRQYARLLEDREDAYDAVLAILSSPEWAAVGADLDELLGSTGAWPDSRDLTGLARGALQRRARRVLRHRRDLAELSPADRHVVRIEAKKLRYGCEFFAGLFPAEQPRVTTDDGTVLVGGPAYASMAEDVQSALGALNDHATADAILHHVGARAPEVDAEALLAAGVDAVARLAAAEQFWAVEPQRSSTPLPG